MTLTPAQASFRSLLLDMLGWLGIDWDEGPDVGGSFGPYQQSERAKVYQHHAGILRAGDLLYPCYCSEEELENGKEPFEARGFPARYSGRCRGLSAAERRRLEDSGRRPVMRLKATAGLIEVEDLIRGATNFARDDMGDFVVIDDAGVPAQVLVQAVDHTLMDVSIVISSEDRLHETVKERVLCEALGFRPPQVAHHGMLLAADGAELTEGHGPNSVGLLRAQGYMPEAVRDYLIRLIRPGDGVHGPGEIRSGADMIEAFDLKKAGGTPAVLDWETLARVNGIHLRQLPPEVILDRWLGMGVGRMLRDRRQMLEVIPLILDHVEKLDQIEPLLEIFTEKNVAFSLAAEDALRADSAREVLTSLRSALEAGDAPRSREAFEGLMKQVQLSAAPGRESVLMPIRAALTGETQGPALEKIFLYLDKNTLLHRIGRALDFIERAA